MNRPLVGRFMRDPQARDWLLETVAEQGLVDEAWARSDGLFDIYPTTGERFVAAQLRMLQDDRSILDVHRAAIFTALGDKLGLSPPRDLGDPEQHAGAGLDPDGFGETRAKVEQGLDGPDKLGQDLEADAKAGLAQHKQVVEEGQDKVAQRSAENKANVEHHQDLNRLEAQRQTEAGAEAAKALGNDENLATKVQDFQEWLVDEVKSTPEWVADKIYGLPPSITEQIPNLPPAAPEESSAAPKEEGNDPSAQKPE